MIELEGAPTNGAPNGTPNGATAGAGGVGGAHPRHPLHDLTARDIKREASPEEAAFLRSPEAVDDWHEALQELRADLESQFSERKAKALEFQKWCFTREDGKELWFSYRTDYELWRSRTKRFMQGVQSKIREAKSIRHDLAQERRAVDMAAASERRTGQRRLLRRVYDYLREESEESREGLLEDLEREHQGVASGRSFSCPSTRRLSSAICRPNSSICRRVSSTRRIKSNLGGIAGGCRGCGNRGGGACTRFGGCEGRCASPMGSITLCSSDFSSSTSSRLASAHSSLRMPVTCQQTCSPSLPPAILKRFSDISSATCKSGAGPPMALS